MKRFTTTGKNVFRDNQENLYYVTLNDGIMITVEPNADTLACIAWSQAITNERRTFLKTIKLDPIDSLDVLVGVEYYHLPDYVMVCLQEYQKSKMGKKP